MLVKYDKLLSLVFDDDDTINVNVWSELVTD